jgi:hypothetical protein
MVELSLLWLLVLQSLLRRCCNLVASSNTQVSNMPMENLMSCTYSISGWQRHCFAITDVECEWFDAHEILACAPNVISIVDNDHHRVVDWKD